MDPPERPPSADASLLHQTLKEADLALAWADRSGRLVAASPSFLQQFGAANTLAACFEAPSACEWRAWLAAPRDARPAMRVLARAEQGLKQFLAQGSDLQRDGEPLTLLVMQPLDLEAGVRADADGFAIDALQREVLEAVALGQTLEAVMDLLCQRVEAAAPELLCSVLTVDAQGRLHPLAGPSLPAAYCELLDGVPIGPQAGSCGTAAWRREPVEVRDIEHDPLWANYRDLALRHGLAACWSSPILHTDGHVVATFALYYRSPQGAAAFHRRMVQTCLQLCRIALQHHEHRRRIERLAFYDEVTGLPNRALFTDRARQAISQAQREGKPVSLLLLDVDRFKLINDSKGHAVGDAVLRSVAECLAGELGEEDTLARLGGDEFVALLPPVWRGASQAGGRQAARGAAPAAATRHRHAPATQHQHGHLRLPRGRCRPGNPAAQCRHRDVRSQARWPRLRTLLCTQDERGAG